MNLVKKIYCRVYQGVFKTALPFLPYRDPIILKKTEEIPNLVLQKGLKRPLLVTDKTIRKAGLTKSLEEKCIENRVELFIYDETEQNPTTAMVEKAFMQYKENNCDCIIAFGGGSPMDCAKAVGASVARPKKALKKMAGILTVLKKTPLIIAVPTTAGTGSETTLASVIVDSETRHKYVINDFNLIPSYAVLDVDVIKTLPASVMSATGMDALTHAVEAYIGRTTTKQTRADALQAVKLIFENVEKASNHETEESEKCMLTAAHLAGRAFTRSYVGYIHAVSHSLSGKYNLPHGKTNAILLPVVLEMYGESVHKKLSELAVFAGLGKKEEANAILACRFIEKIYHLNEKLGIPDKIEEINPDDIGLLAKYADKEANPLYPVPVLWDNEKLKEIYRRVSK